jgi:hypothetical protein
MRVVLQVKLLELLRYVKWSRQGILLAMLPLFVASVVRFDAKKNSWEICK